MATDLGIKNFKKIEGTLKKLEEMIQKYLLDLNKPPTTSKNVQSLIQRH